MRDWMMFKGDHYLGIQRADTERRACVIFAMKKRLAVDGLVAMGRKGGMAKLSKLAIQHIESTEEKQNEKVPDPSNG